LRQLINAIVTFLPTTTVKSISALHSRRPWLEKLFLRLGKSYAHCDNVIQRGPAEGLKFNNGPAPNAGFVLGTYRPEVQKIYASVVKPGMTVYDVGANVGFLAMLAGRLVGSTGRVICFEPLAPNIKAIRHNAALNGFQNMTIIADALGKEDGEAEFLVSEDVSWGRLSRDNVPALNKTRLRVQVRSLGSVIREHKLPSPDVIKVNIEGGETGMLEGSAEVLKQCRPILLIGLCGTNRPVERLLCENGYSSYALGSNVPIVQAPWNAFIIGVPSEDKGKCERVGEMATHATLAR
jgi:FkbM family methyltransferase